MPLRTSALSSAENLSVLIGLIVHLVENEFVAYCLHRLCIERLGENIAGLSSGVLAVLKYMSLYEFSLFESVAHALDEFVIDPALAYVEDGIYGVCALSKRGSLF